MLLFTGDYAFMVGGILREQSENVYVCVSQKELSDIFDFQ